MKKIIEVKNLSKNYGNNVALNNICFDVYEGEFVSIIGSSGAGKSTLLRCINHMITPSSGNVIVNLDDGITDTATVSRYKLKNIRKNIGMIFQHYNLVYRLTALENVLHGRLGHMSTLQGALGLYKEEDILKASSLLDELGLPDHIYSRCDELSGGQKQRVGIARALIQKPKIILCDEPIASLDPVSSKQIMENLKEISVNKKIPCLVNLHQVDVAIQYSDRIIGINNGMIVFDGLPEQLNEEIIANIYNISPSKGIKI